MNEGALYFDKKRVSISFRNYVNGFTGPENFKRNRYEFEKYSHSEVNDDRELYKK